MNFCPFFLTHQGKTVSLTTTKTNNQTTKLLIRQIETQDLNGLCELLANSFHPPKGLIVWVYPLLKLGIYEDLRSHLHSPSPYYVCLVAKMSMAGSVWASRPISGTVEMTLRSYTSSCYTVQYPYIANLAVREGDRRQGIARHLLNHCEQTARSWGFQEIYLHVLETNHQAKQLYFNCGYHLYRVEYDYLNTWFHRPQRLLLRKKISY